MPTPWNSDPPGSQRQLAANIERILTEIQSEAEKRFPPLVAGAQKWHRAIYERVALPVPYYAGEFRDSDARFPELIGYGVVVGGEPGVKSADVPDALLQFEAGARKAVERVDALLPPSSGPSNTRQLAAIAELSAVCHGEWIRIHPFANGNGRTARLWVAWISARYRLPLFLSVTPRPEANRYAIAAGHSMRGNHSPMALYLGDRLERIGPRS